MKKQLGQWFVETEEKLRSWVSANVVILGAPTADIMKGEPRNSSKSISKCLRFTNLLARPGLGPVRLPFFFLRLASVL